MIMIESLDQYSSILHRFKVANSTNYTNMYLHKAAIENYIQQGRLFYTRYDSCLQIFLRQHNYYSMFFYAGYENRLAIEKMDFPLLVNIVRRECDYCLFDQELSDIGFVHVGSFQGFDYDPAAIYQNIKDISFSVLHEMDKDGYHIVSPKNFHFDAFYSFIDGISEIPFWELERRSVEEFTNDSTDGLVRIILDKEKNICGAYYRYIQGVNEYGWIALEKQYRGTTRFALALASDIMQGMMSRGHLGKDWVQYDNKDSQKFHNRLGYTSNGRVRDVYILNKM